MSLLATMAATLPLLLGTGDDSRFYMAELGGTVVKEGTGQPFPSPVPVRVGLYDGDTRVAEAHADLSGRYTVKALPGTYEVKVLLGTQEALAEPVTLTSGSWRRDLRVPAPGRAFTPSLVASTDSERDTGTGGSGTAGGFLKDTSRSYLFGLDAKGEPTWLKELLRKRDTPGTE
ncbi:MAG TPA: hypothetical protein VE153_19830 [Myxococcus sp.]|nr:hypothetical protein [Myxococcus sp.]